MTITIAADTKEMTLSNDNAAWLFSSLGLNYEAEALLPTEVLSNIAAFYKATSGYYANDPALVARITEYLAPVSHPATSEALSAFCGSSTRIDWASNLGSLSDPESEASHRWIQLSGYVRHLQYIAQYARRNCEPIRLY